MITVLIETEGDPVGLSRTLASLVPGAVDGLVRDVVVVTRTADDGVSKVADHAGCRVIGLSEVRGAISGAKGDWLLLLAGGTQLSSGWIEAVTEFLGDADGRPGGGRFRLSGLDRPSLLGRLLSRRDPLERGVLVRRRDVAERALRLSDLRQIAAVVKTREIAAEIRRPRRVERL